MYTPIGSSMIFTPHFGVSLQFDVTAFEDLVKFSVKGVRFELAAFTAEEKAKKNKYDFVHAIGISMEIIQNAIYLHVMTRHDIRLSKETRSAIKSLVLEINTLVLELGRNDSDFVTDFATQRVSITGDIFEFLQKKW